MKIATLIIDTPEKSSNLLYLSGYFCIDAFILLVIEDIKYGWLPSTEFEKAKKNSSINIIYNLTDSYELLKKEKKYIQLKSSVIIDFLKEKEIQKIEVPESFPVIEADNLRNNGFELIVIQEPFIKERSIKKDFEIENIRKNSIINSEIMKKVENIISESTVNSKNILVYKGELLTSEYLQDFIIKELFKKNLWSNNTIVAIGEQGCMPHEYGHGYVYASKSIIIDIYPRSIKNFYFTDMTRTFCKWKASDELQKLYNTVLYAQEMILNSLHAREDGKKLHLSVIDYFNSNGYKTGQFDGFLQGFFHGTGHGVGLDCHEYPYISVNGSKFKTNQTVTVEPGLYYKDIGGVRIEDLVVIKDNGVENLTNYEKKLLIE